MKRPNIEDTWMPEGFNRKAKTQYEEALEAYADDQDKQIKELKDDKYMKGYNDALGNRNWWIEENAKKDKEIKELKDLLYHVDKYCYLGDNDLTYSIKQALK